MIGERAVAEASGVGAGAIHVAVRRKLGRFVLDVTFSATERRVVLFGSSGSGKSLTLRAIAGIFRPETSRIVIGNQVIEDSAQRVRLPPSQRRLGYVPQGYALFPHMNVRQNVIYGLTGLTSAERARRFAEVLSLVGLDGLESRMPSELSGGQQQRVALARAIIADPVVLLLDEPFAAIDAPFRAGLRADLAQLQSATGTTMVTVTHDLSDAFGLGDWIVVLDEGRVLQQGSKDDVYLRPATRKVAELVGIRNILRGVAENASGEWIVVTWNGQTLTASSDGRQVQRGQAVDLCIRSTHLMIRRPDDASFAGRMNVMAGEIVDEAIVAGTRRLFVSLQNSAGRSDLEIDLPEYTYYRLGLDDNKRIQLHVRPDRVHVLPAGA